MKRAPSGGSQTKWKFHRSLLPGEREREVKGVTDVAHGFSASSQMRDRVVTRGNPPDVCVVSHKKPPKAYSRWFDKYLPNGIVFESGAGRWKLNNPLLNILYPIFFPGTRWVGWMNESLSGQPLEITFEFDGPKEFSSVHVHVNNMFTRSVQVSFFDVITHI